MKTKEEIRESAIKRMDEIYPLANEDDYPDHPNVNKINHRARGAFMSGVDFVLNQTSQSLPVYGQWVDAKERKPDDGQKVMVHGKGGRHVTAIWKEHDPEGSFLAYSYFTEELETAEEITHWTPLPPSPGAVEEKPDEHLVNQLRRNLGHIMTWIGREHPSELLRLTDELSQMNFIESQENKNRDVMIIGFEKPKVDGLGDSSGSEKDLNQDILIEDLMNEFASDWNRYYDDSEVDFLNGIYDKIKRLYTITRKGESVKEVSREGEIAELHEKLEEITFYEEEARRQIGIRDQLLEDIFYNRLKPEVIKQKIDAILNLPF